MSRLPSAIKSAAKVELGRNRTVDEWIFSRLLRQLSYGARLHYPFGICDLARINAASRMKFGFRIIFVDFC